VPGLVAFYDIRAGDRVVRQRRVWSSLVRALPAEAGPHLTLPDADRQIVTCSFKIRKNSKILQKKKKCKKIRKDSCCGRGLPVEQAY